ncbi:MAG TPA: hypothetical protein VNK41_11985 [Vicinamibacterales bacterium]|nr:hypothetical protein [Vicinamibacterales bacterium]
MQRLADALVLSPSDLNGFLECGYLTRLELEAADGRGIKQERPREADLLSERRFAHERACRQRFLAEGRVIVDIAVEGSEREWERDAERTLRAMRERVDVIYQGVLTQQLPTTSSASRPPKFERSLRSRRWTVSRRALAMRRSASRRSRRLDYHRREAKPEWWAYFERRKKSLDELLDDTEAIAFLTETNDPPRADRTSLDSHAGFPRPGVQAQGRRRRRGSAWRRPRRHDRVD